MPMPAFVPSDEQRNEVQNYAAVGLPEVQIANIIGISKDTLRKHFRKELDTAAAKANAAVAGRLYRNAMGGDSIAAMFWLKARAGWSDKITHEHNHNVVTMSHEERLRMLEQGPDVIEGSAEEAPLMIENEDAA